MPFAFSFFDHQFLDRQILTAICSIISSRMQSFNKTHMFAASTFATFSKSSLEHQAYNIEGLFCRDFLTFIPTYLLHVLHFFPWIGRGKSFSSTKIKHTVLNSKNDMIPGRSAHDCNPTVTQVPLAHTESRHFVECRRVPEVP